MLAEDAIRSRVRSYRLDSLIGEGPAGRVYRAEHSALETVTLKLIEASAFADASARAACLRELRLVQAVQHPVLPAIHEIGEADGVVFIAYRYVDAVDLGTLIAQRGGTLPFARVAPLMRAVADAVDALHARGVAHRGIKPSNILVSGDDAYLVDAAMPAEPGSALNRRPGMAPYSPPEDGGTGRVADIRAADVYALACVTYEAITGTPPVQGEANRLGAAPAASLIVNRGSRELGDVFERALSRDRLVRFASGRHFGQALVAAAKGGVVNAWEETLATGSIANLEAQPQVEAEHAPSAGQAPDGRDLPGPGDVPLPPLGAESESSEGAVRPAPADATMPAGREQADGFHAPLPPEPETNAPPETIQGGSPPEAAPGLEEDASADAAPEEEAAAAEKHASAPTDGGPPTEAAVEPPAAESEDVSRQAPAEETPGDEPAAGTGPAETASAHPPAGPGGAAALAAGADGPELQDPVAFATKPKRKVPAAAVGSGIGLLAIALLIAALAATGTFSSGKKTTTAAVARTPVQAPPATHRSRAPAKAAQPQTASPAAQITSWPAGRTAYTVVILVSSDSRAQASATAARALSLGVPTGVLRSDDHATLPPGYWVAFAGIYDSQDAAQREANVVQARGLVPSPYVRQIVGHP